MELTVEMASKVVDGDSNSTKSDAEQSMAHVDAHGDVGEVTSEVKAKKHRRGKKPRRDRPYGKPGYTENGQTQHELTNAGKHSGKGKQVQRGGGLRPRYSPQAPRNYTQYIIDDQLESHGKPFDEDMQLTTFLASQFEAEVRQQREMELETKSSSELRSMVNRLQQRVTELEGTLSGCSECKTTRVSTSSHSTSSYDSETDESNCEAPYESDGIDQHTMDTGHQPQAMQLIN